MQLFPPGTNKLQGVDLTMKTMKKMSMMILALLLALSLSAAAFAEETEAAVAEAAPAATEEAAPAETEAAPAETETAAADTQQDEKALYDALAAYAKAKAETRKQKLLDSLKEELDGYVTAGVLTREEADLILNYYTEQMTQTGNGFGRGGKGLPNGQGNPFGQNGRGTQQGGFGRGGNCFPNSRNNQNGQNSQNGWNGQFGQNPQGGFDMGGRHGQFNNTPSVPDSVTGATPNTAAPAVPNQNTFPAPGAFPGR